jgi:hypothetical protein
MFSARNDKYARDCSPCNLHNVEELSVPRLRDCDAILTGSPSLSNHRRLAGRRKRRTVYYVTTQPFM